MLPTSGFFRSIACPFFDSKEGCERVYCHFRHKKKVTLPSYTPTPITQTRSESSKHVYSYRPTPITQLQNIVQSEPIDEKDCSNDLEASMKSNPSENKNELQIKDRIQSECTVTIKEELAKDKSFNVTKKKIDEEFDYQKNPKVNDVNKNKDQDLDSRLSGQQLISDNKDKQSKKQPISLLDEITQITEQTAKNRKKIEKEIETNKEWKKNKKSSLISKEEQQLNATCKKLRVAHKAPENSSQVMSDLLSKKCMKLTPAQIMFNRFLVAQDQTKNEPTTQVSEEVLSTKKKRIAHNLKSDTNLGSKKLRKAIEIKKPIVNNEIDPKVPTNIRQRYLDVITEECLKLVKDKAKAYERAIVEEKNVYKRSPSKNAYLNFAVNVVKRLRNEQKTSIK